MKMEKIKFYRFDKDVRKSNGSMDSDQDHGPSHSLHHGSIGHLVFGSRDSKAGLSDTGAMQRLV